MILPSCPARAYCSRNMTFFIYWIIGCLWWASVSTIYISLRDRDFVGEDAVLARELARRMARSRPLPEYLSAKGKTKPSPGGGKETVLSSRRRGGTRSGLRGDGSTRSGLRGDGNTGGGLRGDSITRGGLRGDGSTHGGLRGAGSRDTRRSGWARDNLRSNDSTRDGFSAGGDYRRIYQDLQNKVEVAGGKGDEGKYLAFIKDWNATNLYAMHLKVAEQAIYGLQQRLEDADRIIEPYLDSPLMRMAFIVRRLDIWLAEMIDYFDYSHGLFPGQKLTRWEYNLESNGARPPTGDNPVIMQNYRHILYYQMILRRYIDVIYSLEFLRKMHRVEVAKHKESDLNDIPMNLEI